MNPISILLNFYTHKDPCPAVRVHQYVRIIMAGSSEGLDSISKAPRKADTARGRTASTSRHRISSQTPTDRSHRRSSCSSPCNSRTAPCFNDLTYWQATHFLPPCRNRPLTPCYVHILCFSVSSAFHFISSLPFFSLPPVYGFLFHRTSL